MFLFRLNQLDQNSKSALGMDERHELLVGIEIGFLVDQLDPFCFKTIQFCLDIIDFERNMMNALASLIDELGDLALRLGRLE